MYKLAVSYTVSEGFADYRSWVQFSAYPLTPYLLAAALSPVFMAQAPQESAGQFLGFKWNFAALIL